MKHTLTLMGVLAASWLLLSGMTQPLLLGLGVVSCLFVLYIARRMDLIDHEGQPIHLHAWRLLRYWLWLAVEVVKSNWEVARCILDPKLPISPALFHVPADQLSAVGKVIYANSITLTPGTVSINVEATRIEVHALTRSGAATLQQGDMHRRALALELPAATGRRT